MTIQGKKIPTSKGRPIGSGHKQRLWNELILPRADGIVEKIIAMADAGDKDMLKFIGDRLILRAQDNHVYFEMKKGSTEQDLFNSSEDVLKKVADGEMLPADGNITANLIKSHRESMQIKQLIDEISTMREEIQNLKSNAGK